MSDKFPKLSRLTRPLMSLALITLALVMAVQPTVYSLTAEDRRSYANKGIYFIDSPCAITGGTATDLAAGVADEANAKIIIGIAKSYELDKNGALIGLMVGITESHLKNLASAKFQISIDNPAQQGVGNDHDSVGIMQQRVSSGWSTKGNGPTKEVIYELMNPAYAAQAFFGTPPGAKLPEGLYNNGSALKKGLLNLDDWQLMRPWEAAQRVQISAYDGTPDKDNRFSGVFGGNYKENLSKAQSYLNNFWDSSPPIPLPIQMSGGSRPPQTQTLDGCDSFAYGNLLNTIVAYAWPDYRDSPYYNMKPEYKAAIDAARRRREYVGGNAYPGIDCGGFVTRAMRDSGTDPRYNKYQGNTYWQKKYMDDNPDKYQRVNATGTKDLPTDQGQVYIAIIGNEHTYFYTGEFEYAEPGGQQKTWSKNGASASIGPYSWRTPMASDAFDFARYNWYRIVTEAGVPVPEGRNLE